MTAPGALIGSVMGPVGAAIGAGIGTVVGAGIGIIAFYKKKAEKIKTNNCTPEAKRKIKTQLQQSMISDLSKIQVFKTQKKKTVCFIGPTSVGKSTLCNDLFNLKLSTGIGKTTVECQKIYETEDSVYLDIPGINNDWQYYTEKELEILYQADICFLIYAGEVSEVRFFGKLLTRRGLKTILVRNQCDRWKESMKPIDAVLQEDRAQAAKFEIKCEIISSGIGMRDQIRKYI